MRSINLSTIIVDTGTLAELTINVDTIEGGSATWRCEQFPGLTLATNVSMCKRQTTEKMAKDFVKNAHCG